MHREAIVDKKSYCDDSNKVMHDGNNRDLQRRLDINFSTSGRNETRREANQRELVSTSQTLIDQTGNFSLAFKLPRNGGKSSVTLCNIDHERVSNIPKSLDSYEFSFKGAGPTMSKMSVNTSLKRPQDDATDEELEAYQNQQLRARRLLGVFFKTTGDTASTGETLIRRLNHKISEINIPRGLGPKATAQAMTTYVSRSIEWAPILNKLNVADLVGCDRTIARIGKHAFGLAKTDSAIGIFLPEEYFGMNVASTIDIYLKGVAREMIVCASSEEDHGIAIRNSLCLNNELSQLEHCPDIGFKRTTAHNVELLASYGFFFRDQCCFFECIFLDTLLIMMGEQEKAKKGQSSLEPLGELNFKGRGLYQNNIGTGNPKLIDYCLYGKLHQALSRQLHECQEKNKSLKHQQPHAIGYTQKSLSSHQGWDETSHYLLGMEKGGRLR
ncbi:hypothetical protein ACHAWF_006127 [Thalassiosira exigua]